MATLIDTSALLALLAETDELHPEARDTFAELLEGDELVTHNYVIVETTALVQRRLGPAAVRALHDDVLPVARTEWIDEGVHQAAVSGLLAAPMQRPSLVDRVSFELMRRLGIERAFAFDRDFRRHGFATIP